MFEPVSPLPSQELAQWGAGTYVAVTAGPGTTLGTVKVQFNRFEHWSLILRTFTAVGYIGAPNAPTPPWLERLKVELVFAGVPNARTELVEPQFPYPHELTTSKAVKELQWLGKNPGVAREFELIYLHCSHSQLTDLLKDELKHLKESAEEGDSEIAALYEKYEISAYASVAYENTFYDELNRKYISEDAKRGLYSNLNGGVLVASVHMPIGELHTHLRGGIRPEMRRRYFLLVHFNDHYAPDIGRKTIPRRDEKLVEWLEDALRTILERQATRLIKGQEDSTRGGANFQQVKEELTNAEAALDARAIAAPLPAAKLAVPYTAAHEDEVIMDFAGLIADGRLPGYSIVGVPGNSTRYDGYFNFTATQPDDGAGNGLPLGIDARNFSPDGTFSRTKRWLEFKRNLEDLLADFEAEDGSPSKKYFDLLDLAVVWSATPGPSGKYDVVAYDSENWVKRGLYGATHYVTTGNSEHRVEVIELPGFIEALTKDT